ncbi:MAG: hypothetical protein V1489_00985 [Candidatus Liptonbacteria bacterium]
MNTPNLKKLITGFLLVAMVVSASALLITNTSLPGGTDSANENTSGQDSSSGNSQVPENAFVEPLYSQNNLSFSSNEAQGLPFPTSTDNISDVVLTKLAAQLIQKNPQGPINANGQVSLNSPDTDALLQQIATGKDAGKFKVPDWEVQAQAEATRIRRTKDTSGAATNEYLKNLKQYFSSTLPNVSQALDEQKQSTADASGASLENTTVIALDESRKIVTPDNMYNFQVSLVKLMAYERNAAMLLSMAQEDPLKAALTSETQEGKYLNALSNFRTQYYKIAQEYGPSFAGEKNRPLIARIFGIPTAHAILGVGDISFDPAILAELLFEWVKQTLVSTIQDKIIHQLVMQTVSWIQGGGTPQFTTNWQSMLTDAADVAAGSIINDIAPGFCKSFGPLLRFQLESVHSSNPPPVSCTLDQVVQNVEAFYNDFAQGGWAGFGEAIMPSGNYFGQLLEGSQVVSMRSEAEKTAKENDAKSGGGFLSTSFCANLVDACPEYDKCISNVLAGANPAGGSCLQLMCPPNPFTKKCALGGTQATTPGQAIGNSLYSSMSSPIQSIVNSNDIGSIVSALINSALNKLTKLVDGKPNTAGLLGIVSSTIGTPTGGQGLAGGYCEGMSGTALTDCMTSNACNGLSGKLLTNCLATWVDTECEIGQKNLRGGSITIPGGATVSSTTGGLSLPQQTLDCSSTYYTSSSTVSAGEESEEGGENCNDGAAGLNPCFCTGRDSLAFSEFCFAGNLDAAMRAVVADWQSSGGNVGLTSDNYCGSYPCVDRGNSQAGNLFGDALSAKLRVDGLTGTNGGEYSVTGHCPTDPPNSVCRDGECVPNPRTEGYAIIATAGFLRYPNSRSSRAICIPE